MHPDDNRLMTLVDAGGFRAGSDGVPTWLPGFYIDVYPVTNADYAAFVEVTGRPAPAHWPHGQCPTELKNHPVVNVTWWDADGYAVWAGKVLPTPLQWEKAARGVEGVLYPWGSQPDPTRCNVRESRVGGTTPVNWHDNGVSPYGAYDMCGNVWEWCAAAGGSAVRERRGGAYTSSMAHVNTIAATEAPGDWSSSDTGFRCAMPALELLAQLAI